MYLPQLAKSLPSSSLAFTMAPNKLGPTTLLALSAASSAVAPMAPPPTTSITKQVSRQQVQSVIDEPKRFVQQERAKRPQNEERLRDAMLNTIFKSVLDDAMLSISTGRARRTMWV